MTIFISGGCKNGKSTLAEDCCIRLAGGGPLYYVATMVAYDAEDRERRQPGVFALAAPPAPEPVPQRGQRHRDRDRGPDSGPAGGRICRGLFQTGRPGPRSGGGQDLRRREYPSIVVL